MRKRYMFEKLYIAAIVAMMSLPNELLSAELQKMVVTATKYEKNYNDVGISMSVIDGDEIYEHFQYDFDSISSSLPNVSSINNNLAGLGSFRIRGIGINEFQGIFEGPVAVHIDEVAYSKPFMLGSGFYDIESIEVLKSAQGTLFGRNTIGGSVNYQTKRPTDYYSAGINSTIGNYESIRNEGYISGPIYENTNGRLAFLSEIASSGPYFNQFNNERVGQKNLFALRGKIEWLDDKTALNITTHAARNNNDLVPYGNQLGLADSAKPSSFTINQDYYPKANDHSYGTSIRIEHDIHEKHSLISLSSYEYYQRDHREDSDNRPVASNNVDWFAEIHQFAQELRLHGELLEGFWNHTSGVNFHYDTTDIADSLDISQNPFLTGLFGVPSARLATQFTQKTTSFSLYTNHEFSLSDDTTLSLGMRYSRDDIDIDGNSFIGTAKTVGIRNISQPIVIVDSADTDRTDENVSFSVGLSNKFSDTGLLFANISSGYHSGGYDFGFASLLQTFEPETSLSGEIGVRSYFASNTASVNASLFWTKVDNYQTNVDFAGQVVPRRTNIGSLTSKGAEIDVVWQPTNQWDLRIAGGYNDASIDSDKTVVSVPINKNKPVNTPELSLSASASYIKPISHKYKLKLSSWATWIDERFLEIQNLPQHLADDYYLLNAKISFMPKKENWSISVWGRNITNQKYLLYINDIQPLFFLTINGEPATFGAEFSYHYY